MSSLETTAAKMRSFIDEHRNQGNQLLLVVRNGATIVVHDNSCLKVMNQDTMDLIDEAMDDMFCKTSNMETVKKEDA